MPLSVAAICDRALRRSGFQTQTTYIGTQVGDIVIEATNDLRDKPFTSHRRFGSLTLITGNAITLSSLTNVTTTATGTTASAHGFLVGQLVSVAGANLAPYNGEQIVVSTPTATTFTYLMASNPGGAASGTLTVTNVAYPLPAGFRSLIPDTAYLSTNTIAVMWSANEKDWAYIKAGNISPGSVLVCRQIGQFLYVQNPNAGDGLRFEFLSSALWTDLTGETAKSEPTLDTDLWAPDDEMLVLELRWRWKKEQGDENWQIDAGQARQYTRNLIAANAGARAISMAGSVDEAVPTPPYTNLWR